MGRSGRALRFVYGVTVLVGVIWLLSVCTMSNPATKMAKSKHGVFVGQERLNFHQDFHLNYVSKRRVPNGPDPIHNRRAAKSGQPPGRA